MLLQYMAVAKYDPEKDEVKCRDTGLLQRLYPESVKQLCRDKAENLARRSPNTRVAIGYDPRKNSTTIGAV